MSQQLRGGIKRLELTTKFTLATLALASGVYTYLGVRGLLNGTSSVIFFGAVIYATAVSVGIYAFWTYLMRFMPHIESARARSLLTVAMLVGSLMIVAMSSWLNAAALAGGAALEQHLANTTESYQQKLEKANANALAAQSLLPDIRLASERFSSLSRQERSSGALTGTSGSGTVVQLLKQMSDQLNELGTTVENSRDTTAKFYQQGGRHLAKMRRLVSSPGPIEARSNAYAEEAVALASVIASIQQTSVAPSVQRTADDLGRSFIAPAANGRSADLASRQTEVVTRVERSVKQQARALSDAAAEILRREQVQPIKFTPLSTPEAVLLYARDFLPSWAGAISIDLMPGVMIMILCVVQGAIRRGPAEALDADAMTAGELIRAVNLHRAMNGQAPIATLVPAQVPELSPDMSDASPDEPSTDQPAAAQLTPQAARQETEASETANNIAPLQPTHRNL